jgi:hypothetical protein
MKSRPRMGCRMHQKPSVFVALWRSPLTRPSGTLSPTGRGESKAEARLFSVPLAPAGTGSGVSGPGPMRERIEAERLIAAGPTFHQPSLALPESRKVV